MEPYKFTNKMKFIGIISASQQQIGGGLNPVRLRSHNELGSFSLIISEG